MSQKQIILRILLVILAIAVGGSIIAQVSNQIKRSEVWSPSGLKTKPNDLKESPRQNDQKLLSSPNDIPDEVAYGQVFRHLEELNRKADEERQNNRDGMKFSNFYQEVAQLDEKQARTLDRISAKTNRETKKLDERAKQIIQEIRAKTPNGRLPQGQLPPPPPPELEQLTKQRKDLILQAITELRQDFGEAEFGRFANFVNQRIKTGIQKNIPKNKK